MNKSKIKKLMWWSVGSLAILIFVTISLSQEFYIALLGVLLYCALPTLFISLSHAELNKSDVKTIEEFDAQEDLNQHIKSVNKKTRQEWLKGNKKKVIVIAILSFIIIAFLIFWWLCENVF